MPPKTRKLNDYQISKKVKKLKTGPKEKYKLGVHDVVAEGLAREGANDDQIAQSLGISRSGYYHWRKKYPEFNAAVERGKRPVDFMVENKLLQMALEGDFKAVAMWLNCRKPEKWSDRQEVKHSGNIELNLTMDVDFD